MNFSLKPPAKRNTPLVAVLFFGFVAGILIGSLTLLGAPKIFQKPIPMGIIQPSREPKVSDENSLLPGDVFPLSSPTPYDTKTASQNEQQESRAFVAGLVGKPAPDFELKTLDGKQIRFTDLKGKAILINVWASWCLSCRDEMPVIQAAYDRYKSQGLVVLGIDFLVQDNLKDVNQFVNDLKITFPILLDETGAVSGNLYGVRGLPTSFLIDRDGVIRRTKIGPMSPDEINQNILDILN